MGADLDGIGQQTPSFFVWAVRDTYTAPLQRVQIIKGYVDAKWQSARASL